MEEVEDEPLFCERVAGIDIGKKMIMVTIRVPSETRKGGRQQETREFGTTRKELLALADWLRCWQVEKAGMESTSDYWKPVYFLLEREGFDCTLYQASQVKALPGRPKTDKLDSAWLARITERGSLAGSFVPPEDIRRLRTHTRYRRKLVQMRTAQKERCEKLLEDGHLKLSSVISDIHGVSGRDMLGAIAAGEHNPKVLADKARGVMRGKIARLEEALDCSFFTPEHAFVLQMMLDSIDQLTAQIQVLDEQDRGHVPAVRTADRAAGRHPGVRDHHRPGPHRRDRRGHERIPDGRAPGLLGQDSPSRQRVRRQAQGQERHRPRQPLHRRRPRRGIHQHRPHPDLPRRAVPAHVQAHAQDEGPGRHHAQAARHRPRPPVRPRGRDTKTSALTTTNAGKTPTAAPAASSASWNASATRSHSHRPRHRRTPPPAAS